MVMQNKKNADIWEYLGYGISYNKWKDMDYSYEILEELHKNILNRQKTGVNYPQRYAEQFSDDLLEAKSL